MATVPIDDRICITGDGRFYQGGGGGSESEYFIGTIAQWEALTSDEKSVYDGKAVILTEE